MAKLPKLFWKNVLWTIGVFALGNLMVVVNRMEIPGTIHRLESSWDLMIPLVLPLILVYLAYFPYVYAFLLYMLFKKPEQFKPFALTMIVCGVITAIINVTFQTYAPRAALPGTDLFSNLLRWHYGLNEPLTSFPSLHVIHAVCIAYFANKIVPRRKWFFFTLSFWISISTLLVKQHYIPDVIAGFFIAYGVSSMVYNWWQNKENLLINEFNRAKEATA